MGGINKAARGEQKVLGVIWDMGLDDFVIDVKSVISAADQIEPTKHNVISLVSRIYDPLGLISPVIVRFKVLFQELCQAKLDWDEPFTESLKERWKLLLAGLQTFGALRVPRLYTQ